MLDSPIEEIKSRLSVTDVLSEYIQLRKAGVNFKAVCPFHSEKTPSFVISPVKQIWHCFGCGLGGDIFEFVKQIENVEFAQALKILADKAGIELRKPTVNELQLRDKKDLLVEINEAAAAYYERVLWESNAGKEALAYLKDRGLSDKTIKLWHLGYAPADFHYLENFLAKTFKKLDIVTAGLIIRKDDGTFFDRFHGRIMFPIANSVGDIVGFTGRLLKEQENTGKYVNSPETPIYNKSQVIYGLHAAKNNIRKENRAILVEGNMDVIACHQAGFSQTIASSGTAITAQQLETLQRLCENLVFAFDSDNAGTTATRRALELALSMSFSVKIVDLGQAKDPDELIKKGIGIWQKAVDGAPHYAEFFFNKLFKQYDSNSVDGKREITKEIVPLICRISDSITKAHFVRKLSEGLNVGEQVILDLIQKVQLPKPTKLKVDTLVRKDRRTILEQLLLGLSLNLHTTEALANFTVDDFTEENRPALRAIQTAGSAKLDILKKKFPDLADQFELLSFAVEVDDQQQAIDPKQQMITIARELNKHNLKRKMEDVSAKMAEAQRAKDSKLLSELTTRFTDLSKEISKIP